MELIKRLLRRKWSCTVQLTDHVLITWLIMRWSCGYHALLTWLIMQGLRSNHVLVTWLICLGQKVTRNMDFHTLAFFWWEINVMFFRQKLHDKQPVMWGRDTYTCTPTHAHTHTRRVTQWCWPEQWSLVNVRTRHWIKRDEKTTPPLESVTRPCGPWDRNGVWILLGQLL